MALYLVTTTFKGSQYGWDAQDFVAGEVYDLTDSLGATAMREGWAKPVDAPAAKDESKAAPEAPENKAIHDAPSNKRKPK